MKNLGTKFVDSNLSKKSHPFSLICLSLIISFTLSSASNLASNISKNSSDCFLFGTILKAKTEALKILVEAEKKSEERKDAILKDAHAQREKMIKSGEAEVEKQKEIAMKDLQVYARNLISDFTEKLVSNKTASTLIDEAIDKVGEE